MELPPDTQAAMMRLAIEEARLAQGWTHPNPAVGAVIVCRGEVLARGRTQPPGKGHAEVQALSMWREAGHKPEAETTLYVTLEPCSTRGRTPPCTEAIIESGIRNVVVGAIDPNPAHRGKGIDLLSSAGLRVMTGLLASECEDLNIAFHHWMKHGRPLMAGKVATTLDGRIATRGGQSRWITGAASRADVHSWRASFPAIAVGSGTVRTDNPSLTVRRPGLPDNCPIRFVFDRNLVTLRAADAQVFQDEWKEQTVVVSLASKSSQAAKFAENQGIRFWFLDDEANDDGIGEFIDRCAAEQISGVYIEGGAHLLSSFLRRRRLDYLFHYRAPLLLADNSALAPFYGFEPSEMSRAIRLADVRHALFGDDQLLRGRIVYPQ